MPQQQLPFLRSTRHTSTNPPPPPTITTESSALSDLDSVALDAIDIDTNTPAAASASQSANHSAASSLPSTPATPSEPSTHLAPKPQNKDRKRTSHIYDFMRNDVPRDHVFKDHKGREEWCCKFCQQTYLITGGTRAPKRHLEWHGIFKDSSKDTQAKNIQSSIQIAMSSAAENPFKRRRMNQKEGSSIPIDGDVLEVLYVKFLAVCNQPLRLAGCPEFRTFLKYLNPDVDKWLNTSASTIGKWVLRQAGLLEKQVKQRLQNARSKIHIATDLWTSPNEKAIMVIVAHYLSEDNVLERAVLDLIEVEGTHKGVNLAPYMMKTLEEWGIISKLGWFMMDNAGNNDTMLEKVSFGK